MGELQSKGIVGIASIALDVDWSAIRFRPQSDVKRKTSVNCQVALVEAVYKLRAGFRQPYGK